MPLRTIEVEMEDPEDHDSTLRIIYRGTDTTGQPFFSEDTGVTQAGVAAAVSATLDMNQVAWAIHYDVE